MTQEQLADKIGTRARNIVRWEKAGGDGAHEPRAKYVVAIAAATGHDLSFFFEDENGSEPSTDDEEDSEAAMRRVTEAFVDHLLAAAKRAAQEAAREGSTA